MAHDALFPRHRLRYPNANATGTANYDVPPDGRQFLMVRTAATGSQRVTLVENWFEELQRVARTD